MSTINTVEGHRSHIAPIDAFTVVIEEGLGRIYNGRITEAWKKGNSANGREDSQESGSRQKDSQR